MATATTEMDTSLINLNEEECWQAIRNRNTDADGRFYYSVTTTGVFCRPSCPSRLPKREHVNLHLTRAEAEQAGFRACKRCKPDEPSLAQQHASMVANICQLIESSETALPLAILAKTSGMSRYHFHRVFKSITGLTPKAYGTAYRAKKVRQNLSNSHSVTQTIYDTGFNSNSRFYATTNQMLGMTPTTFRNAGADTVIHFAVGESSLGAIIVASTEKGICAIALGDDPQTLLCELQDQFPRAQLIGGDKKFEQWVAQVVGLVEKPDTDFNLPLDIRGTVFQTRVWRALQEIPVGSTASYSEIAKQIGSPKSARAVAKACASNTIAIAIPCHRVIRSDGSISGYRWGIERKNSLLLKEKQAKDQQG